MTAKLQTLIEAARELSPLEQLNLIRVISQSLYHSYRQMEPNLDFWEPQRLEQLIEAQQTQAISDIASLRAGFWPEDESADDLIEYIYGQRQEDRVRDN
jgi:hypothetical protein